jgi:hypothetical protein
VSNRKTAELTADDRALRQQQPGAPPGGDGTAPGRGRRLGTGTGVELAADERRISADEARELRALLGGRRPVHRTARAELFFRRSQAAMRRRIAASRRLAAYDDAGTVDPVAPAGRWDAR